MHRIILLLVAVSTAFAEAGVGGGDGTGGGTPGEGGGNPGAPGEAAGPGWILPAFFVLMGFMLWSTFRSQKKEKQKQAQLVAEIKEGDQVETIGGLRGTVKRRGEDELDILSGETVFTIALGAVKQKRGDDDERKG